MPFTRTTPQPKSYNLDGYLIMSYLTDNINQEIHIHYVEIDDQGNWQKEDDVTLSGPDFTATITAAQGYINTGDSYYVATKKGLYDGLISKIGGPSGTVT